MNPRSLYYYDHRECTVKHRHPMAAVPRQQVRSSTSRSTEPDDHVASETAGSVVRELTESKPWSAQQFEKYRPHLVSFLTREVTPILDRDNECSILIRAPVKSGKREMVEYLAARDKARGVARAHVFISAWYRRAEDEQRLELRSHGLEVFSLGKGSFKEPPCKKCCEWIDDALSRHMRVVAHVDECDYGSAEGSTMNGVWDYVCGRSAVSTILYSATPEEVMFAGKYRDDVFSEIAKDCAISVKYTPPPGYCGPARFISEKLVHEAAPFFAARTCPMFPSIIHTIDPNAKYVLTDQAREIITGLRANASRGTGRNILILRLSYNDPDHERASRNAKREDKAIHIFVKCVESGIFPELNGVAIQLDDVSGKFRGVKRCSTRAISWSSRAMWEDIRQDRPMIVVIDQAAGRSTEFACHDRLYAIHDFRYTHTFTTVSQAQERVNHYEQTYGGFQPIHIYGHRKTLMLSADKINYEQYDETDWVWRGIFTPRSSKQATMWELDTRPQTGSHASHPWCPGPVDRNERIRLNGLFHDRFESDVSDRVRERQVTAFRANAKFYACDRQTFYAVTGVPGSCRNPFVLSDQKMERYPGEHPREEGQIGLDPYTSRWRVLQFGSTNFDSSFKMTFSRIHSVICYRAGVLGVAICTPSEMTIRGTRLETSPKSMYNTAPG
jgi:hypothetical protein